tara:strand:- start:95 stop:739 length:645 start_codon:yes stop_codon:yes gene_type:complete
MDNVEIKRIDYDIAKTWILHKHYAKRLPNMQYMYGCFEDKILQGVITYGQPPSPALVRTICGEKYFADVLELNRIAFQNKHKKNILSFFVSQTLKKLPKPKIIISYADKGQNHNGYIYQATNFIYTGLSDKGKDKRFKGNLNIHSRSISPKDRQNKDLFVSVERSRKHRYLYFLGTKRQIKEYKLNLTWDILPYPKGISLRYNNNFEMPQQSTF